MAGTVAGFAIVSTGLIQSESHLSLIDSIRRYGARVFERTYTGLLAAEDRYLDTCKGIIHVGANVGQERRRYSNFELRVVWIEPIPRVHAALVQNIARYPDQLAINALIADRDGIPYTLHVANNNGESSSILELLHHKDIWPDVGYVSDLKLISKTLPSALKEARIDWTGYDALVMDVQGAELLVLKGATELMPTLRYIKTEAADFESYRNCVTLAELTDFLHCRGFSLVRKDQFAVRARGGMYYNVLYRRATAGPARDE